MLFLENDTRTLFRQIFRGSKKHPSMVCPASGVFVDAFPRKLHKKINLITVGAFSIIEVILFGRRQGWLKKIKKLGRRGVPKDLVLGDD